MNTTIRSRVSKAALGSTLIALAVLGVSGVASAEGDIRHQTDCASVGVNCGENYCVQSGWRPDNRFGEPTEYCWTENCTLFVLECIVG